MQEQDQARSADLDEVDIHAAAFARDPYPVYEQLRANCPVMRSERYGGFWLLTRYDDVRRAALDWRTYTSSVPGVTAIPVITRRTEPQLPIEMDPPLHSRYRALINPVFSPERVEALRPTVLAIATALIDPLVERGEGDLVIDYAVPLSVQTLAAFAGLPVTDSGRWVEWIRAMFDPHHPEASAQASRDFGLYIDELIAAHRATPSDDFIGMLMAAEVEGHQLTDREIHSFCTVLFGAGFETTADALSVGLLHLAEHPEDRKRLAVDPDFRQTAIEEFLRFASPVQIFGRNAVRDVTLHGRTIRTMDIVALSFGSANHDPTVFPDPERCALDRTPNRHLAFGAGPHLCLGAPVARLEMAVTLEEFTRRIPDLAVSAGADPQWKTRGDRRGLATLPVTLGPGGGNVHHGASVSPWCRDCTE